MRRPAMLAAIILATVTVADQLTKAWAWRHLDTVYVNPGGSMLFGASVGVIMKSPGWGAVVDVLDSILLAAAATVAVRFCRNTALLVGMQMIIAGWASNLLDRLGMHYLTAPGSARGAVDFLPWEGRFWNLADFTIIAGTTVLTVALPASALRAIRARHSRARRRVRLALPGRPARLAATGAIVTTIVLATFGALAGTGVTSTAALAAGGR